MRCVFTRCALYLYIWLCLRTSFDVNISSVKRINYEFMGEREVDEGMIEGLLVKNHSFFIYGETFIKSSILQ